MAHVFITYLDDSWDCEDCGGSYAHGAEVIIDGEPFGDFAPIAHCYSGTSYSNSRIWLAILEHLGLSAETNEDGLLPCGFNIQEVLNHYGHTYEEDYEDISVDTSEWDDFDEGYDDEESA